MSRQASVLPPSDTLSRSSSTEGATQLVGQLDSNGVANLAIDSTYSPPSRSNSPRSMKVALDVTSKGDSSGPTTSDSSEEDYDAVKHELSAVMVGGKGGGFDEIEKPLEESGTGSTGNTIYEDIKPHSKSRPNPTSLKTIPVTLNKLNEKGRCILTADDQALREILKSGIEREKNPEKKRRKKFSDLVFTRRFTAFDRQNSTSADSPFHGFFVLFWLGTAFYCARLAAENWAKYGNILGTNEIAGLMFHRDVMVLGLSDGVMCGVTGFGLVLQKLICNNVISWNKEGWIIQSVWEAFYILSVLGWTLFREWPWTHTVFFMLHGLVMLMKQHSYAFYNGHLSENYKSRETLRRKLKQLDNTKPVQSPSETTPAAASLSTSYLNNRPTASDLNQRRQYRRNSLDQGEANIKEVIMNLVSQSFIYPVVIRAIEMKDAGLSLKERLKVFPWILSDLMFPFMTEYMLTWYVIWELILNLLAEVTFFADRGFYADWWNSVSWDQFARDWNRPVHNFLLRHVYHSSISSMQVNKKTATLITFFLSACVHELVMWCLFKKLRGYLLMMQMLQLPLVSLSRTRWLKGRATLGNLIFWIGIFTGPSLLCSLYLII
ncbi:sterol O-acyltransferase 1 [Diplocarpon mali]|nr:sterol O-acyltransferase 1 [Diplocarpon mali]